MLRLRGFIVAIACSVLGSLPLTRLCSGNSFGPKAGVEIVSSLKGNTSMLHLDILRAFFVRVRVFWLRFTTVLLFLLLLLLLCEVFLCVVLVFGSSLQ